MCVRQQVFSQTMGAVDIKCGNTEKSCTIRKRSKESICSSSLLPLGTRQIRGCMFRGVSDVRLRTYRPYLRIGYRQNYRLLTSQTAHNRRVCGRMSAHACLPAFDFCSHSMLHSIALVAEDPHKVTVACCCDHVTIESCDNTTIGIKLL